MATAVRQPRAVPASVLLAGGALAGGLYVVNPNTTHIPLCPLHALTGLQCPLCGSTRAAYALLHLQFGAALADNALLILGGPLLALWWWRVPRRAAPTPRWLLAVALVVVVAFSVLRNLSIGTWLAPPG